MVNDLQKQLKEKEDNKAKEAEQAEREAHLLLLKK